MTNEEYRLIEQAFNHAVTLSHRQQEAFIQAFATSNPELGPKLRQLIVADAEPEESLADPILGSVKSLDALDSDHWIGHRIGVWNIVRRVGTGGMGAVFLARRQDGQFDQEAALKIMGAQLLNANAAARFRTERQILANLNHPNIAKLIDGGTTDDNLPFLVMEFINGPPIDAFCDALSLTLKDRLRLFLKVCEGVDHAHRNLVVHRDLKPSNILVTDSGEPKLLDFGIAKLLEPSAYDITLANTRNDARLMTPEYASPEQIRGEQISVATDVYALGVLLFRLLTGQSPYGPSVTSAREIESAILDVNPKPPSAIVGSSTTVGASVSGANDGIGRKRAASVEQVRKSLSGDLDNIVLKCLQKAPERRYATVRELSADINRYLNNRPVIARGNSWTYTAKKFLVRNAKLVAAAAVVFATLASLVTFYTLRLANERDKAQLAAAEAEQVSAFLGDIFASASPSVTQGDEITILDLINQAQSNIEALGGQDKLQGKLLFIMGDSYYWLGRDEDAATLYRRSLEHYSIVHPKPVADIVESKIALGDTQARLGEDDAAFATLKDGRALAIAEMGPESSKVIWFDTLIASNHLRLRQTDEAVAILEDARDRLARSEDQDDALELFLLTDLATALDRVGRIDDAMSIKQQVITRSEEIEGKYHPNTIVRIYNFSLGMRRQWQLADALGEMKIAIERGAQTWDREDPTRRSHLTGYAINLEMLGRFDEAKALREEVRDLALEIEGEDSRSYVAGLFGTAMWNKERGNLKVAAAEFEDVLERSKLVNGETAFFTNLCRIYLAQTYNETGDSELALKNSSKAMENRDALSANLDLTLRMQHARALLASGDVVAAKSVVAELITQRDLDGTQAGPQTVSILTDLARFYRRAGMLNLSEGYARRAYMNGKNGLSEGNWYAALAAAELAYVLEADGRTAKARPYASEAHADLTAVFGPEDYRVTALAGLLQK